MYKPPKQYKPNGQQEVARRLRHGLMTKPGTWTIVKTREYLEETKNPTSND